MNLEKEASNPVPQIKSGNHKNKYKPSLSADGSSTVVQAKSMPHKMRVCFKRNQSVQKTVPAIYFREQRQQECRKFRVQQHSEFKVNLGYETYERGEHGDGDEDTDRGIDRRTDDYPDTLKKGKLQITIF